MATKNVKAKMPQHRFSGDTNVGEHGELTIGDPDIWGNGVNNMLVQPSIRVQGQRIVLNAAARLTSTKVKNE